MRNPIGFVAVLLFGLAAAPALAFNLTTLGEEACTAHRTLSKIKNKFAWAEHHTWRRGFVIETLENPRLRYDVFGGQSLIDHTHCRAEALMTDGRRWTVYYIVEKWGGFASIGTGVEYCVVGLDPWRIHDGYCRTLR